METSVKSYRTQEYHQPVKRYCRTLDLRNDPELIAEYRRRHSRAEPDEVGNAVDQHGGLAGARARQNQQRALGGKDRLPLHGVEPRKPALNILVAQREIFLGDVSHGVHLSF